jgi:hypothetical protein
MAAQGDEISKTQRDIEKLISAIEANRIQMQKGLEKSKKLNAAIESSKAASLRARATILSG